MLTITAIVLTAVVLVAFTVCGVLLYLRMEEIRKKNEEAIRRLRTDISSNVSTNYMTILDSNQTDRARMTWSKDNLNVKIGVANPMNISSSGVSTDTLWSSLGSFSNLRVTGPSILNGSFQVTGASTMHSVSAGDAKIETVMTQSLNATQANTNNIMFTNAYGSNITASNFVVGNTKFSNTAGIVSDDLTLARKLTVGSNSVNADGTANFGNLTADSLMVGSSMLKATNQMLTVGPTTISADGNVNVGKQLTIGATNFSSNGTMTVGKQLNVGTNSIASDGTMSVGKSISLGQLSLDRDTGLNMGPTRLDSNGTLNVGQNVIRPNGLTDFGNVNINGAMNVTTTITNTSTDNGPLIEKKFNDNGNRYGLGSFANGSTRIYTADGYIPSSVNLSWAKVDGSFDDVLRVTKDGQSYKTDVKGSLCVQSNCLSPTDFAKLISLAKA
jgi:hypothetical protein